MLLCNLEQINQRATKAGLNHEALAWKINREAIHVNGVTLASIEIIVDTLLGSWFKVYCALKNVRAANENIEAAIIPSAPN